MTRPHLVSIALVAVLLAAARSATAAETAADLIVTDAKIYTEDAQHSIAEALAVRGEKIVYVGSAVDVKRFMGPKTQVEMLNGRLVLPGLIDSHIHPLNIADVALCSLRSRPMPLKDLTASISKCLARYPTLPRQRIVVYLWTNTEGNQPDSKYPTLRAALDAVTTQVPIQLVGNDGLHDAFNSLALAQAKNAAGKVIGLSKATLATEFRQYRPLVEVDAAGEPAGVVSEKARDLLTPQSGFAVDLGEVAKAPEKVTQKLNAAGVTGFLDARVGPEELPIYDKLYEGGHMTARAELALFYDLSQIHTPDWHADFDSIISKLIATRKKYAQNPLIRADFIKIFADGESPDGNPYVVPPTQPTAAMLRPFLQPLFGRDASGNGTVTGYVDTASALCQTVRAHPDQYATKSAIQAFIKEHGHHPAQCKIYYGEPRYPREVILEYVRRAHAAGFSIHFHTFGSSAARVAIDAIEAARKADGNAKSHDGLAHLLFVDPTDISRFGRDHLYAAFTYAWIATDPEFDITAIPFYEKVIGNSYGALHSPGSYYESNAYPVRAIQAAGGTLVAGSDAPVGMNDPRPFVNMAQAVTRSRGGLPALNSKQSISLRDVLDAYTVHGADMLFLRDVAGSIEAGKSGDFIVLDRDILTLADSGRVGEVADTKVLETWFRGKKVYSP